jgi:branched-chain amino acid transport system substrate-binding protein
MTRRPCNSASRFKPAFLAAIAIAAALPAAAQEALRIPILVPVSGFLSLEGTSQRNGALLAVRNAPAGAPRIEAEVMDTGTSPEVAVNALEKALGDRGGNVVAVAASMLGTQMLAMLPVALDRKVPLVTVSGTTQITEMRNPYVFRFFPGDEIAKAAHARYVVQELGKTRPAVIYQTTAYGQGGRKQLDATFKQLGVTPVFEEGLDVSVKDYLPVLGKATAANPDVLVLHLHAGPTALIVRQAVASGIRIPIVAGSAIHQPVTAALLEPSELKGICAETASSPVSGGSPGMDEFLRRYREAFGGADPDAYALAQYDGMAMVLDAIAKGAKTPEAVREALATGAYRGVAMTYNSDGKGNMAHSAEIICYDGTGRVPKVVKRYDNLDGVR